MWRDLSPYPIARELKPFLSRIYIKMLNYIYIYIYNSKVLELRIKTLVAKLNAWTILNDRT